jgi:hypothetical protein
MRKERQLCVHYRGDVGASPRRPAVNRMSTARIRRRSRRSRHSPTSGASNQRTHCLRRRSQFCAIPHALPSGSEIHVKVVKHSTSNLSHDHLLCIPILVYSKTRRQSRGNPGEPPRIFSSQRCLRRALAAERLFYAAIIRQICGFASFPDRRRFDSKPQSFASREVAHASKRRNDPIWP